MSNRIYTGVWTDWSLGRVAGATITLSARDGGLLLAFIAIFVTVIAARLWRSLTFVCHQVLASGGKHDGLHYQRQVILRNVPAPVPATWLFLQQAWHWRGRADRPLLRTVPWAACGFLYAVLLGLAAVFSSKVSESATPFRLLAATEGCGMFVPEGRDALQQKNAYDNSLAAVYSRQCYGGHENNDDLSPAASCGTLPVPSIRWTNASAECPFADEVCMGRSFRMETGMVDSHTHLGINDQEQNRVRYWRETDCAPLVSQRGFSRFLKGAEARELGWDDDVLIKYMYGGIGTRQDYTHIYNTYGESTQMGYSTWAISNDASSNASLWRPVEALALDRRDLTLLLIAPNAVVHLEPNDDPVFGAHIPVDLPDGSTVYRADRYASPVACADRHRICNPNNGVCTAPQGSGDLVRNARAPEVGLNAAQAAAVDRIGFFVAGSTFHQLIWTRTQSYLRAQELVAELLQLPLPPDQWQIEMGSLFAESLAKLQHQMTEYVTGPSIAVAGAVNKVWEAETSSAMPDDVRAAHEDMCHRQRTRDAQGTLNFSVLGLAMLLGLGSLFVALSYALEPATAFLQRATGLGAHKARRWERDDNLQVMRMLFEAKDAGVWRGSTDSFPTTESRDYFEWDGDALGQHSRYTTLVHENYDKS